MSSPPYQPSRKKLYQCLRWHSGNVAFILDPEKRKLLLENPFLKYTQVIVVLASAQVEQKRLWRGREQPSKEPLQENYAASQLFEGGAESLVSAEPDTETGTIQSCSIDHTSERDPIESSESNPEKSDSGSLKRKSLLLLHDAVANIVSHTPALVSINAQGLIISLDLVNNLLCTNSLRSLCIDYCAPKCNESLPPAEFYRFKNLKRLSLNNLWGNSQSWLNDISSILLRNSGLEHLTLSFKNAVVTDVESLPAFFANLCKLHGSKTTTRLSLKSLRLGEGIEFPDVSVLKKMLHPHLLEVIYVNNEAPDPNYHTPMFAIVPPEPPTLTLRAPWELLLSKTSTPRLRSITLHHFPQQEWDEAQCLLQRAFDDCIEVRFAQLRRTQASSGLYSVSQDIESLSSLQKVQYPCPRLHDSALRGSEMLTDCIWITHLIFQLGSGFDDSIWKSPHDSFFPRLCIALGKLPCLEALWVPNMDRGLRSATAPGNRFTPEEQLEAAESLARHAGRRLRYVRFGDRAWRVTRPRGSIKARNGRGGGFHKRRRPPVLEPLDAWEDEMECPAFFHVTKPMQWSEITNHCEWRET